MKKISIKREQSQAGLSFAERENRRSLAGGESNFRPQVKNKLFLLLALLLTAATGAWAEDIVISPASGADISTALATATDGKTVGNITINLAQNGAYTVSSAMEVPAGLTINGNGATINAESLTEGNGMFLGTGKDSPTRADIQISDLTIKSLGKSLYYSNGQNNYGDFIMNNCLVEVTSSVIVFNYTKGSAVVNLTLTNSTFYAPTATTTQFYSSQSGQKLTAIINDATQEFSFQNCTLYNMAKNKNFFVHRQNNQKWLSYEAKNSIFVNCGKSGEVVKGMNGGSANVNPTWSIDGNLFNYDGADTSANETTGDTSEGEGVQNSVAGVVTFKDPSNGDFSGIITKSDNSTVDLTLGDPRWTAAAVPAATTYTVSMKDGVKDADKWTVKVGEGLAQALPIGGLKGDGSETVTLQYNGRLKVKGVKATSDAEPAKEPATVTTAPTGAAVVGVGKTTALVSGGEAEGGKLMYAMTTTDTKPTSTDGFSDAVPTAQTITASGTVYVWYYVKGDDTHSDSEIAATAIEVPVADIIWDATNVFNSSHQNDRANTWNPGSLTYEGISISVSGEEGSNFVAYDPMSQTGLLVCYGDEGDSFTFTAPSGMKFCKIEIINNDESIVFDDYGDWTSDETGKKLVWSGTAANAVTLGTVYTVASKLNSIAFYLSE